jgi:hypothetical protein
VATPRTEVTINYEPAHFLEQQYEHREQGFTLTLDAGKATAVLDAVEKPLSAATLARVERAVKRILQARQLTTHKPFKTLAPVSVQHTADGGKDIILSASDGVTVSGGLVDLRVTNANGEVVHDSRAERIAKTEKLISDVLSNIESDPILERLLAFLQQAIADPADEFTHLYGIRETLQNHFGSKKNARDALNISEAEWDRFDEILNNLPVDPSRHRGRFTQGTRPATPEELDEAREIARRWIERYKDTL